MHPGTKAEPVLVAWGIDTAGKPHLLYSPQFSLWLLPWFASTLPDIRLFIAFQVADIAVFVTRFSWFADFEPGDLPSVEFQLALLARGLVLLACVVAWIRGTVETAESVPEPAVVTA